MNKSYRLLLLIVVQFSSLRRVAVLSLLHPLLPRSPQPKSPLPPKNLPPKPRWLPKNPPPKPLLLLKNLWLKLPPPPRNLPPQSRRLLKRPLLKCPLPMPNVCALPAMSPAATKCQWTRPFFTRATMLLTPTPFMSDWWMQRQRSK